MTFLPLEQALTTSDSLKYAIFGFLLVIIVLAVLAIFVKILTGVLSGKKKESTADSSPAEAPKADAPAAVAAAPAEAPVVKDEPASAPDILSEIPHTPGYVVLDGISEQDAAVIMAITSEKTGVDLDHLDFKSIRRITVLENVEDQDAAAIMAITSKKTGIPLENLIFNSIKLVED